MTSLERSAAAVAVAWAGLVSCGPDDADDGRDPGSFGVLAAPVGGVFSSALTVELVAERPAEVWFTEDGSLPVVGSSRRYTGPIRVDESTMLTFLAVDRDGWRSSIGTEYYGIEPPGLEVPLIQAPRSLTVWPERLVFTPGPADPFESQVITLTSEGTEPVTVEQLLFGPISATQPGYDPEVFLIVPETDDPVIWPGQSVRLEVTYFTTRTARSAGLTLVTDATNEANGRFDVTLIGRMFP